MARKRSRSRRRRGGKMISKDQMKSIGAMAAKTQEDALAAQSKASSALQDMQTLKAKSLATGIPSLCNNPFMKNSKKCQKALGAAKSAAGTVASTAGSVKSKAADIEKKIGQGGLSAPVRGGRRKSRRSRRGGRKSRRSRRGGRKSRRSRRGGRKSRRSRRGGRKSRRSRRGGRKSRRSRRGGRKSRRSRRR